MSRKCLFRLFFWAVSVQDIEMSAHRDLNNDRDSVNVVLLCSTFRGGGLWLEAADGNCPSMDGTRRGHEQCHTMSGITFNPHRWHETRPWEGHRITIAMYTIKAVRTLDPEDAETLPRQHDSVPLLAT